MRALQLIVSPSVAHLRHGCPGCRRHEGGQILLASCPGFAEHIETISCIPEPARPAARREESMRPWTIGLAAAGLVLATGLAHAADEKLLGIVSIAATEANNVRYIAGATAAAKEDGWTVSVIDAAGSADQANAAIQNFAGRDAAAII